MRGKTLGVGFGLALFSPAAWRTAGRSAREAVIIVRNISLFVAAMLAAFVYWWQQQSRLVHVVVVVVVVALAALWLRHRRRHRAQPKPVGGEPTQVLYRWWEPDDLQERLCYCGKPRVPGELVYVGITGAHRSRELDDDRQTSCWWREGLVGTTQTYRTRDEVERAERQAIRSERPRENKQHAVGW